MVTSCVSDCGVNHRNNPDNSPFHKVKLDSNRQSVVYKKLTRRATGFVRKSTLPPVEDDDDEDVYDSKKHNKSFVPGFVRKQDVPTDDYEEEIIEEEAIEEKLDEHKTGFDQDIPQDENDEEEVEDILEPGPPQKTILSYKAHATSYACSAPVDYDNDKNDRSNDSDEPLDLNEVSKKKAAGFAADNVLEKIKIMSKLKVNQIDDSDSDDGYKVHMSDSTQDKQSHIKRRPTGFVHASDLLDEDDDDDDVDEELKPKTSKQANFLPLQEIAKIKLISKIHIDDSKDDGDDEVKIETNEQKHPRRRPTGFVKNVAVDEDDDDCNDDDDNVSQYSLPPIGDKKKEHIVATMLLASPDDHNNKPKGKELHSETLPYISQYDTHHAIGFFPKESVSTVKVYQRDDSDEIEESRREKRTEELKRKISAAKLKQQQAADDMEARRKSIFTRPLYAANYDDTEIPTLKNYRPITQRHPKNLFLTAPSQQFKQLYAVSEETARNEKYIRESLNVDSEQQTKMLQIQHGPKISAVISSDYVQTLEWTKRFPTARSLRSMEYARARPVLTIKQYQEKNRKYKEEMERKITSAPLTSQQSTTINRSLVDKNPRASPKVRPPKMQADIATEINTRRNNK